MEKPTESLDDYVVKPARETTSDLLRGISSRPADESGALEDEEVSAPVVTNTFLLWVHRFVAVGSVLAMIAFILLGALSAFLIVIGEPATERTATTNLRPAGLPGAATNVEPSDEPEVATDDQYADESELMTNGQYADEGELADEPTQTKERLSFFSASKSGRGSINRSNARRKRARPRIRVAAYRRKRLPRWRPQPLEQLFLPTTLVIYVENGVIKTRLETWPRPTPTPNN